MSVEISSETENDSSTNIINTDQPTNAAPSEVLFSAPPSLDTTEKKPIIINEVDDKKGTFYLGQSYLDASSVLYEREINILHGSNAMLYTDLYEFSFYEGEIDEIKVKATSQIQTTLGLNFGDSFDKMIQLYDTEYTNRTQTSIETGFEYFEYVLNDHAFCVEFLKEKVSTWLIYVINA